MTDPAADLPARLKAASAGAHRQLERDLDLLRAPLSQTRFTAQLRGFWGFHAAWEPVMRGRDELTDLMTGRYRLGALATDLRALGMSDDEIEALPLCEAAASLARSTSDALGLLYVMEGSTLGGRMIAQALRDAPWLPAGGLSYFNPYGPRTAARWRAVKAALAAAASPDADPVIEAAALMTFAVLGEWLAA